MVVGEKWERTTEAGRRISRTITGFGYEGGLVRYREVSTRPGGKPVHREASCWVCTWKAWVRKGAKKC